MADKNVTLSAFADEIALDFAEQLQTLNKLNVPQLDLRAAWGVRVDNLSDEQVEQIVKLLYEYDIQVACLGSPIGKSPIQDSIDNEINRLKRLAEIAPRLGTKNIRFFSFYPQREVTEADIQTSIERIQRLVDEAEKLDLVMLLENEIGLVGDTPERMLKLFQGIDNARFRFIWDPANFVQCGAEKQVDQWWDQLSPYIGYIHIKDAKLADGSVTPAGDGDGQVEELLRKLLAVGYDGVLSLEPHLQEALHSSGFTGPDQMKVAVDSLRKVMSNVGMTEA
jgi:sugar phosphate isomerase/epimerase